jgi:ATP/maltotriose-dependent transcriptional regulator MalT/DNA-binding SARP family transcriptional activator
VPRRRLYTLLDGIGQGSVWLQGPPGAGKTTLAASYAHGRPGAPLWYRLDAADADPAVFFGHFRAAARRCHRRRSAPPHYGPEHLGGITAFARVFFAASLPRRGRPLLLVLDDCHALPAQAPTLEALAVLAASLPPGCLCLFLSRQPPPAVFASLMAQGQLHAPAPASLRFDASEADLLARRWRSARDPQALQHALTAADGWPAALALLLRHDTGSAAAATGLDHLAAEAWAHLPAEAREPLLATSVLHTITPEGAAGLSNDPQAPRALAGLAAEHFLVSQADTPATAWRVHALWRPFLQRQARARLGEDGYRRLQARAADLALAEGRQDEAADLYAEAADWPGLAGLITRSAAENLAHGRHLQLLAWLARLPEAARADPWLPYWEGMARLPLDPKASLACMEAAHRAFGEQPAGRLLAAAGALTAIGFAWDDTRDGPRWLAELARLEPVREGLARDDIDAAVIAAGFAPLHFDLGNPLLARWAEAARRLLPRAPPATRTLLASFLCTYHVWHGELAACRVLLRGLLTEPPEANPLFAVTLQIWWAVLGFLAANHDAAGAAVRAARSLAERYGLVFNLPQIHGQETYIALSAGDLPAAERAVAALAAAIRPGRRLDLGFLHHVRSGLLLLRGEYPEARREAERSLALTEETGCPTNGQLVRLGLAQILARMGLREEADAQLDGVEAFCAVSGAPLVRFVARITRADAALSRGDADAAAAVLAEALPQARLNGWYNPHPFWQPAPMARLCALALSRGIEPDYVHRLIRLRNLPPPPEADAAWPWPVRIRALGPLEVEVADTPLDFPVRTQGKPLELLRRLIAHGGERVPLSLLADALWPEADGDHALAALKTTVQRLRGLIGADALVQREGRLGLSRRAVWLDLWAFEDRLRVAHAGPETLARALELYRGPLLADDPGDALDLPARPRLHAAWLAVVERLCEALLERGQATAALQGLRTALAMDPLSEVLQRRHLELCLRLELTAEAVRAYREYERLLATHLGIAPGRGMQQLIEPHLNHKKH